MSSLDQQRKAGFQAMTVPLWLVLAVMILTIDITIVAQDNTTEVETYDTGRYSRCVLDTAHSGVFDIDDDLDPELHRRAGCNGWSGARAEQGASIADRCRRMVLSILSLAPKLCPPTVRF